MKEASHAEHGLPNIAQKRLRFRLFQQRGGITDQVITAAGDFHQFIELARLRAQPGDGKVPLLLGVDEFL